LKWRRVLGIADLLDSRLWRPPRKLAVTNSLRMAKGSALHIPSGERVLDIGAETGRLATHIEKIVGPSGWVVAIDPLPLRVEIAQSKVAAKFGRVGRAEDLSEFGDMTFDVCYFSASSSSFLTGWRLKPGSLRRHGQLDWLSRLRRLACFLLLEDCAGPASVKAL